MRGTVWEGTKNQWPARWRSWAWHLHLICRERKPSEDVLPLLVSQQRFHMTNFVYQSLVCFHRSSWVHGYISIMRYKSKTQKNRTNVILSNEPSVSVPIRRGQEDGWVGISCQHICSYIRQSHTVLGEECALSASDISVGSSRQETLQSCLECESLRMFTMLPVHTHVIQTNWSQI